MTVPIHAIVTAQNPGGRMVTGRYVGAGKYPNTVAIEWFGPWFYERTRQYVGSYPIESMHEVTETDTVPCMSCRSVRPVSEMQGAVSPGYQPLYGLFVCRDRDACFAAFNAIPLNELERKAR